ncbi:hypothetical protein DBP20_33135 [Streptomyces sp. CS131]|nr:hypothetical protein DBP20_33135 [Streptomyces sp. CS131]
MLTFLIGIAGRPLRRDRKLGPARIGPVTGLPASPVIGYSLSTPPPTTTPGSSAAKSSPATARTQFPVDPAAGASPRRRGGQGLRWTGPRPHGALRLCRVVINLREPSSRRGSRRASCTTRVHMA